ncbi:MAG: hypothetical protein JSS07_10445 [Proteobacteria bacterium]|nr:hypothetical protein [Pseudomonadota bacterium]
MNPKTFQDALKKGLGRAYQHIKMHGDNGYEEAILSTCAVDQIYGSHLQTHRAPWLYALLCLTKRELFYFPKIVNILVSTPDSETQVVELCKLIAMQGITPAKEALYQKFDLQGDDVDICGQAIIELDGLLGLLHISQVIGKQILENKLCYGDWLFDYASTIFGENASSFLKLNADDNPSIAAFLQAMQSHPSQTNKENWRPDFKEILTFIEEDKGPYHYYIGLFGEKYATHEQINFIFNNLITETRKNQCIRYLTFFARRAFPRINEMVLGLALSQDHEIQNAAIKALSNSQHHMIHELAISLCNEDNISFNKHIGLFIHNYQVGDYQLIESMLRDDLDEHKIHEIAESLIKICKKHMEPGLINCLLWLYEHSPCSRCRKEAVLLLIKHELLPEDLLQECQFDCDEQIRDIAKRHIHDANQEIKIDDLNLA